MIKRFKILAEFVKDISSETPNIQTYLFVKDNILTLISIPKPCLIR